MYAKLMCAKPRHDERGQAIVETVIFLPMFLIALFGIMWAVQAAVQYERVESTVRFNGLISQGINPYADYSLYSMYTQLGSTTMPLTTCVQPILAPLSDGTPTYTAPAAASGAFWSPSTANPPTPSCALSGTNGLVGIPAGTGVAQDVILRGQLTKVISNIPVSGPLQSALGSTTSSEAHGTFFKPVGVNVLLACYPSLNTQITSSLEYAKDTSAPVVPTPLGTTVTAITPGVNSSCTNW